MNQTSTNQVRWTTADLELLPDNGNRYEIVDGELFVTRAPHWGHQKITDNICMELKLWSRQTGLGEAVTGAGIIFTDADNVIPDVVWISNQRLASVLDDAGHLTAAPELVVEVLSPGQENERRDRQVKLKLCAAQGVREYWIVDWQLQQIQVYRPEQATLILIETLFSNDNLSSPLLPGFTCDIARLFS
ncbi:Uma2 family endonuclease [aff. Roholtiella sp. LEGE 12411]|uniref:Uma2 family endonuclease n=1 Tax=aff. Roholtiella sp. LEGE 12411 TaxID=1828822 RepID=UPI001880FF97|nr:Uma2 family endonuclease [aff. Roholtiella sp. LEGE 12411]MBE9034659.1 Uma2 family endonuclease [aff. Roholtiella sp. LEGE 12411]